MAKNEYLLISRGQWDDDADKAAVQAQFGKTGATCKACHDEFRN